VPGAAYFFIYAGVAGSMNVLGQYKKKEGMGF
jgi:hypothetical protein